MASRLEHIHVRDDDLTEPFGGTVDNYEKWVILNNLHACDYNRQAAAKACGISLNTLRNKLIKYGYLQNKVKDDSRQLNLFD